MSTIINMSRKLTPLESASRIYFSRGVTDGLLVSKQLGMVHHLVEFIRKNILSMREKKMAVVDVSTEVMGKNLAEIAARLEPRNSKMLYGLFCVVRQGGPYDVSTKRGGYYDPTDAHLPVTFYVADPKADLSVRPRVRTVVQSKTNLDGSYYLDVFKSIAVLQKFDDRFDLQLSLRRIVVDVRVPIFSNSLSSRDRAGVLNEIFKTLVYNGKQYRDFFSEHFTWKRRHFRRTVTLTFQLSPVEGSDDFKRDLLKLLNPNRAPEGNFRHERVFEESRPTIIRTRVTFRTTKSHQFVFRLEFEYGTPRIEVLEKMFDTTALEPMGLDSDTVGNFLNQNDPNIMVFMYDGTATVMLRDAWERSLESHVFFRCHHIVDGNEGAVEQNIDRTEGFFDLRSLGFQHHIYVRENDLKAAFNYKKMPLFEITDTSDPDVVLTHTKVQCRPGYTGNVRSIQAVTSA